MTKCANCTLDAKFLYSVSKTHNTYFCEKHAPRSLRSTLIPLVGEDILVKEVAAVAKASKKSKTTTVINSTPVEEVVDSISNDNEPTEEEVTEDESDN